MKSTSKNSRGFTLIELLVVIAIITLLLPAAVQQAREATRRTQCKNNLKQLGLALHNYHDVHNCFPSGWIAVDPVTRQQTAHNGANGAGWGTMILPYLDQSPLYNQFNANLAIHDAVNVPFINNVLPEWQCPSDPQPDKWEIEEQGGPGTVLAELPTANYIGSFGTEELHGCENAPGMAPVATNGQCRGDGIFYHNSRVRMCDITDGPPTHSSLPNVVSTRNRAGIRRGREWWPKAKKPSSEFLVRPTMCPITQPDTLMTSAAST